ncbi:MAG: GGDEF domain-containing protein [Lachnospiraceae bacterium]|nr:GGDEF domain-containing protein [Lachnospiraceae bacterium]
MENLKEYKKELRYQEIKSNKYTLKGFMWFLLSLCFVWLLTVIGFFEVDKKLATIALVSTIVLFLWPFYIFLKGDLGKPWIKYFFLLLICIAVGVICSLLSYHAVLLYVIPLLFALQYRRRGTIWFVYGINTFTMLISMLANYCYGIYDLNLVFEGLYTRSGCMSMVKDGVLILPFNEDPIFVIIVFGVFPRTIILLVFSIMLQYAVVNSNEDALKIAQLTYLKETDTKTRVFNKNKYEEMVVEYYPKIEQIGVTFWDLNNLKYLNDRYGHAVGDMAIETLSSALNSYSSDRCRIYRIGGDEFLLIIDNPTEHEMESIVKSVKENLEACYLEQNVRISSAVGIAYGMGKEIAEIVKVADTNMYVDKKISKEGRT